MFRSSLDFEILAAAHRDDLRSFRTVATSGAAGPFSRGRRAVGYRLIALGQRLTGGTVASTPRSIAPLRPADGQAR